jgi:hypothetical protein
MEAHALTGRPDNRRWPIISPVVSQWFLLELAAATGRSHTDLLTELNEFLLLDDIR